MGCWCRSWCWRRRILCWRRAGWIGIVFRGLRIRPRKFRRRLIGCWSWRSKGKISIWKSQKCIANKYHLNLLSGKYEQLLTIPIFYTYYLFLILFFIILLYSWALIELTTLQCTISSALIIVNRSELTSDGS